MIKNIKALAFGFVVALLLCEIILRIYNPLSNFTRQGRLILPANQQVVFQNKWIRQLDPQIHYSRNALGFRGPMPADSIYKFNSVICVGGSTTACFFLSDTQTWPWLLQERLKDSVPGLWINNAGLDGHSTFGHLLLLKEYVLKLKPKYVLLLTGVNDVETSKPENFDQLSENKIRFQSAGGFLKSLLNQTETGATLFQLYSIRLAYKKGLIHKEVDFRNLPDTILNNTTTQSILSAQQPFLTGYRNRLQELIQLCKANGTTPILLTQPSLYGAYTDPATGVVMNNKYLPIGDNARNNLLQEQILESYNDVVRSFRSEVPVIDLARLMPKNTSLYYDFIHFNKAGAAEVASLLAGALQPLLKQ